MIPSWLLAAVILTAAVVMRARGQVEHAFTRFCLGMLYVSLTIYPETELVDARFIARWLMFLTFGVEVLSWLVRRWVRGNHVA